MVIGVSVDGSHVWCEGKKSSTAHFGLVLKRLMGTQTLTYTHKKQKI